MFGGFSGRRNTGKLGELRLAPWEGQYACEGTTGAWRRGGSGRSSQGSHALALGGCTSGMAGG